MMTRDEFLKTLQQLSKRTGFSIVEISYMARMMVQAEYDPRHLRSGESRSNFPNAGSALLAMNGTSIASTPKSQSRMHKLIFWKRGKQPSKTKEPLSQSLHSIGICR